MSIEQRLAETLAECERLREENRRLRGPIRFRVNAKVHKRDAVLLEIDLLLASKRQSSQ
jgi:hypothetical protein